MRKLVTVRRVDSVHPIEGADAIERARVGGWDVVVKKVENYKPGDLTIFFEIDSALPLDGFFGFLANRSPKRNVEWYGHSRTCHVIRTAKLRGVVSQGLMVLPSDMFGDNWRTAENPIAEGDDLTQMMDDVYGVTKWEAPLPSSAGGGEPKGNFPTQYATKTNEERIQNLSNEWEEIIKHPRAWVATEKIDGTSSTFVMTEDEGLLVCSRNWMIKDGPNFYWNIARKYDLENLMPVGAVLQGEIYGEGIQGNRLGVKGVHLAAFNFEFGHAYDEILEPEVAKLTSGETSFDQLFAHVGAFEASKWHREVPRAPYYTELDLASTIDEAIAQVNGIRSLISPDRLAEGVVWKRVPMPGRRDSFKAISNKYLLKEKG